MSRVAVVTAYWNYHASKFSDDRGERSQADRWLWASDEVNAAVQDATPDIVDLLVALAGAAPDNEALAYLGAGPLESLIGLHGPQFAEEIDRAARMNESFRTALRCVWYSDDVDPVIVNRLRRFGPPL